MADIVPQILFGLNLLENYDGTVYCGTGKISLGGNSLEMCRTKCHRSAELVSVIVKQCLNVVAEEVQSRKVMGKLNVMVWTKESQ